ncbi:EAL domain-containing protein [Sulfurimonas sp.]|uniref:putative bifunctional diguanylate cyclase/phosphodiesterase n=1 Tax=Sulfurimonas sp. TaxID=2022749 RepID=UPI0025CBEEEE|nr:EAL domain-containing protein [Sulfurimonas sp.]MCK9473199.1 EAL domain-containing protein [Sulfurimonas sp.]MDD3506445.1 EAL domain-containing protein [Sulfurimonas sp.]
MNINNVFAEIVNLHPSRIAVYDKNGNFLYANTSYIETYGIDISEKENLNFDKIKAYEITFEYVKTQLSISESFSIQKLEDSAWFESLFFYTTSKDVIHICSNITTLKEADKKIYYHANYDSLTALPNRSYFKKQLKGILQKSSQNGSKIALLFIDLDKFKEVNDTYGHDIGDKMLVTIAKRLLNSVRKDDIVARIGGDEFVLIAKDIKNIEIVEQLALKLQKKIRQPLEIDAHIFNVTLSIGISIYPQHGTTSQELLKNADVAMYEVKKTKRDDFRIYNKSMSSEAATKLSMKADIIRALEQNEFVMHYQPVVDFRTNSVIGAEALVRWYHSKRGILEPNDFLELILSGDLDREFNCMVVSKVLKDLVIMNKAFLNKKLIISINISKSQFFSPTFSSNVSDASKNYGIDKSQIELKIVENQIMKNASIAKDNIEVLHLMGFKIALDDFGVEHSSLNHLKNFKVDKLKIDRLFIKNIAQDKNDLNIVKSIVNTAKLFNLKVQAEGIETKEQYLKLKKIGCDFSQGFYHSSALPMDDFIRYYNKT